MALTVQTWPQISKTERFGIGFVGTNVSQPSKCKETVFLNLFVAFCYSKIKYRKGSFQHEDKSALRLVFKVWVRRQLWRARMLVVQGSLERQQKVFLFPDQRL